VNAVLFAAVVSLAWSVVWRLVSRPMMRKATQGEEDGR